MRGPLDVIRETWEAKEGTDESVVSYILSTQETLRSMMEVVETKAQSRQKQWYDKGARLREFQKGDPVLVLLPTSSNKLLAQWQGLYQVIERTGKVTYKVDMHDKRKRHRVNMLKDFRIRSQEWLVATAEEVMNEVTVGDVPLWDDDALGTSTIGGQLSQQKRGELNTVLAAYKGDVLRAQPGRTTLAEHQIHTDDSKPVRLPPYRLPHAYREQVQKELQKMLYTGIIEKSRTAKSVGIFCSVGKEKGWLYRRLNSVSAYPMPRIDDLIDRLGQAKFITTLDLTKG